MNDSDASIRIYDAQAAALAERHDDSALLRVHDCVLNLLPANRGVSGRSACAMPRPAPSGSRRFRIDDMVLVAQRLGARFGHTVDLSGAEEATLWRGA
jgi:hypothetical protein